MKSQMNAATLLKDVRQQQLAEAKRQALKHPRRFVKIARERGYNFNQDNLEAEIDRLSDEELASLMNPGVGPRQHLVAR